jgi:hypothetical protein
MLVPSPSQAERQAEEAREAAEKAERDRALNIRKSMARMTGMHGFFSGKKSPGGGKDAGSGRPSLPATARPSDAGHALAAAASGAGGAAAGGRPSLLTGKGDAAAGGSKKRGSFLEVPIHVITCIAFHSSM